MSEEFWIIGIIKDYHKKVKDNIWVLVIDKKDARHRLQRLSKVDDYLWISYRYNSAYNAELALNNFLREKFKNRYKFKILHYIGGKFLDYYAENNTEG
jgi:hypothetical protein